MSSDLDDIINELKISQRELQEAHDMLVKPYPNLSKEKQSTNQSLAVQDLVMKELYIYVERLYRIVNAHSLHIKALYESIMSLPEVKTNEKLKEQIKARFDAMDKLS